MDDREETGDFEGREEGGPEESAAATLPPLVDGEEHHVDPRTVQIARSVGLVAVFIVSMVPLVLFTIGWAVGGIPGAIYLGFLVVWLVLALSLAALAYRWPAVRYRHLLYLAEEDGLRIRRGVFWRKVIWIPITRVQHTDVSQGPLQRRFDLGTLTVHTAGTAGASISLEGLEHGIATRLSEHLRPESDEHAS